MNKRLCISILFLILSNMLLADYSIIPFTAEGTAISSDQKLLKNELIIVKNGKYTRIFKTDSAGNFTVDIPLFLPCFSGFDRDKLTKRLLKNEISQYNEPFVFYYKGESFVLQNSWSKKLKRRKIFKSTILRNISLKFSKTNEEDIVRLNELSGYIFNIKKSKLEVKETFKTLQLTNFTIKEVRELFMGFEDNVIINEVDAVLVITLKKIDDWNEILELKAPLQKDIICKNPKDFIYLYY